MEDTELVQRQTINDVWAVRVAVIGKYEKMCELDDEIQKCLETVRGYRFYRFEHQGMATGEKMVQQEVDQRCWMYLVRLYELHKYILCTDYNLMMKELECFKFPEFTPENAVEWLSGLKHLVYESVQKLIESVFQRIVEGTYWVGGWNGDKKKRNNNGVDKYFMLTTHDNNRLEWYTDKPTVTDDLEKACYIMDGKTLPDETIKDRMRREKVREIENEYFKIKVCKNGNTHYWLEEIVRQKLNFYGAKRGVIGENVRIKVFEKR